MSRALFLIIILAMLAQLSACGPKATKYVNPAVDFSYIHRVAIFPFQNTSSDIQAAARIQSIFLTGVLDEGELLVVDQGEVLNTLRRMKMAPEAILSPEQIVALGQELAVEGIFFGTVEEYGQARISNAQVYNVTASFSLAETETGTLIWNSQVSKNGTSFWRRLFGGGTASLYDVSRSAVDSALGTLF